MTIETLFPMAILRQLREDYRDFPATMWLGTSWVVVFLAMLANFLRGGGTLTPFRLFLGPLDAHPFGDLTVAELFDGEVWRTLTATFVHYGLLHIGVNLWALYQIGTLVESWYGSAMFAAIYVLTGAGGNLISGMIRRALRELPYIHAGGGSTVIMGLVALCAVVGWRAKNEIGDYLKGQMVWVLVMTAGMGIVLVLIGLPVIDNWGHFGGSVMGAAIGLANRGLVRRAGRRSTRLAGAFAVLLIAASAFALVADDRAEGRLRRQGAERARRRLETDDRLIARLERVREVFRTAAGARPMIVRGARDRLLPPRTYPGPVAAAKPAVVADPASASREKGSEPDPDEAFSLSILGAVSSYLRTMDGDLARGVNAADYRRTRQIVESTLRELPTLEEVHEVDGRLASILTRVRIDREAAEREQRVLSTGR